MAYTFYPKYYFTTGGSLYEYGLVPRKLKRWNEFFIHAWQWQLMILYSHTSGFLPYILLFTQAPIPVCLDGTIIVSSTILVTMYYCGYVVV